MIQSNHGNHSKYNRTWSVWTESSDDAGKMLRALANHYNDVNNLSEGDEGYEVAIEFMEEDLKYYHVVYAQELINYFEGSGSSIECTENWAINVIEEEIESAENE